MWSSSCKDLHDPQLRSRRDRIRLRREKRGVAVPGGRLERRDDRQAALWRHMRTAGM